MNDEYGKRDQDKEAKKRKNFRCNVIENESISRIFARGHTHARNYFKIIHKVAIFLR